LGSIKASAGDTGGAIGFFENTDAPERGAALHAHLAAAEAFYVLEGAYEFLLDGAWYDAPAGSFVFVPPGVAHGFRAGPDGARKIGLFTPGGTEMQFVERKQLVDSSQVMTPDAVQAFAERFGVTLLGPLPARNA
jgi:uncharacterized cupin superfamily protein